MTVLTQISEQPFHETGIPVGSSKGGSSTSVHADRSNPSVFKKNGQRHAWLAQIIVYSMSVDGPVRPPIGEEAKPEPNAEKTFLAGSKALDSLDRRALPPSSTEAWLLTLLHRLITSVETFFHPSNFGAWTFPVREMIPYYHSFAHSLTPAWSTPSAPHLYPPLGCRIQYPVERRTVVIV